MTLRSIPSALTHTLTSHGAAPSATMASFLTCTTAFDDNAHMWDKVQSVRDRFWFKPDRLVHGVDTIYSW